MDTDLNGKVAIVTGGSRGIGKAIASELASAGAKVMITSRKAEVCEEAVKEITEATGGDLAFEAGNAGRIEDIERAVQATLSTFGSVDILINNAGITRDNILIRMKQEEWDEIINTNLNSVFKMSKAVLRGMMKKKAGRIISITSVVGSMGNSGQANYAAAKAGIMGFTKSLAREVGSRGITVNTVAPGFIQTDMTAKLPDEQKEVLFSQIPMARLGSVEEIAQAVLFLAGDGGSYITAQTLHVNGGMYSV